MTTPSLPEQTPPHQVDVLPPAVEGDRERVRLSAQDMLVRYAVVFERLQDS